MPRHASCLLLLLIGLASCSDDKQDETDRASADQEAGAQVIPETQPVTGDIYVNGVYVPADLEECFVELDKLLTTEVKAKFKSAPEDDISLHHHGLGAWIRGNWGLWGPSRLAIWFRDLGALHPDDMSSMILDSYWRRLNDKPIELEKQIKHYQDYWEEQQQKHSARQIIDSFVELDRGYTEPQITTPVQPKFSHGPEK